MEDRRGSRGTVAGGSLGVAVLALVEYLVFGVDPSTTQQVASQLGGGGASQGALGVPSDDAGQFVDIIGANINDVWQPRLQGYTPPKVVLYSEGTPTGCGAGQAAMGPFYCPANGTVYLDLGFWQVMEQRLGASGADFARAYVIAHEFAHHIQRLTGASARVAEARRMDEATANPDRNFNRGRSSIPPDRRPRAHRRTGRGVPVAPLARLAGPPLRGPGGAHGRWRRM